MPAIVALGLASCAGTAVRDTGRPAPPAAPAWIAEAPHGRVIGAVGREDLPGDAPERLLRDLADARACELVRDSFASRAADGARRLRRRPDDSLPARLRAGILRTPFPGCAIVRREFRADARGRRWCWALAVLDSTETLPVLEKELRRTGTVPPVNSPLDLLDRTPAPSAVF